MMNNEDYAYTLHQQQEDPPYVYKQTLTYSELIEELNTMEIECKYPITFLETEPKWEYTLPPSSCYITRLPKKAKPEVFIPSVSRIFK